MIAEIAGAQHAMVGIDQLRLAGLSASGVRGRVARGSLHPRHRGVYAVGHLALTSKSPWMAAVLACGAGALLSHRSCACLAGLRESSRTRIDVTAPGRRGRRRGGIDVHSAECISSEDVWEVDDIPCTSVARTIIDLATCVGRREVEKALDRSETLRVFDLAQFDRAFARLGSHAGVPVVRAILGSYAVGELDLRNELEEAFFAMCRRHGIPLPKANVDMVVGGERICADFYWPQYRLIVEVDGFGTHGTRQGFARDRRRDRNSMLHDLAVARFTRNEVFGSSASVAGEVFALIRRQAATMQAGSFRPA